MINYLTIIDFLWELATVLAHLGLAGIAMIFALLVFAALAATIRGVCAGK